MPGTQHTPVTVAAAAVAVLTAFISIGNGSNTQRALSVISMPAGNVMHRRVNSRALRGAGAAH